ncbi:MAG: branched-chain amino acid ABC transporter permease [Bacillota bacterium]|nr:branched-chain amino acid ABC transporter permease [Bacillota bacterium]
MALLAQVLQQVINGLVLGSTYALIALGLTMLYGILGLVNWAHGEIYMLGAFAGFYFVAVKGLPFYLGLIVATLAMAAAGVFLERLVFRPLQDKPHMNMIIGTLGLSTFLLNGAIVVWGSDPKKFPEVYSRIISLGGVSITVQRALVVVVTAIVIAALAVVIRKARIGKAMRACSEDMEVAALMGVEVRTVAMITSAVSAALAAIAGTLVGPIFLVYPQMSIQAVSKAFAVVIMGGLGNVEGAIVGGFLLGLAESLTAGFLSSFYKEIVSFVILILVLVFRPSGLFGRHAVEKV